MISRCTNWGGHRFEARYSTEPTEIEITAGKMSVRAYEMLLDAATKKTYERDICVHCGATVEKTK